MIRQKKGFINDSIAVITATYNWTKRKIPEKIWKVTYLPLRRKASYFQLSVQNDFMKIKST